MRNIDEHTITEAVIRRMDACDSPRLKEVLASLVRHLHDFAREVRLTEAEWFEGIRFLTATGHMCDDKRQEFILLSDTLGLSMLLVAMNQGKPPGATEATVFGPFHVDDAPRLDTGADMAAGAPGEPLFVDVQVVSTDGTPIADAEVDVWQADEEGLYDVQRPELAVRRARGVFRTDAEGRASFRTIVPTAYPIPTDGPVGRMLVATGRHPWRPAHVHFLVKAPGHETLVTHLFRDGDPYLDSDVVFGVRSSLVARMDRHPAGPAPDGTRSAVVLHARAPLRAAAGLSAARRGVRAARTMMFRARAMPCAPAFLECVRIAPSHFAGRTMNTTSPWPWFAGTGLFLGLGLPLAKAAAQHGVGATDFALWPTLAAGVLLAVLAQVRHGAPAWTGPLLRFAFVAGLLGHAAPMTLVFWLSAHAGAGFAALAFTLPPVFTLGIALALRLQRADLARVSAVAIGLAGALLLATARGGSYRVSVAGMLGLLAVPALIGAGNVYRSLRLPQGVPGEWLGALTLLASSVLLLAGRAVTGGGGPVLPTDALPVLGAQVLALAAGYACYFALQRRAEPVLFSFMGYVVMATGVAAGMAAFGERPAWTTVPALALIGAALALIVRHGAPPRATGLAAAQGERA